jgi:SAM-dependent methyltransferase
LLTVRYDWLGLRPGERVLDFGCGGGRHSFEAMRRGAVAVAVDSDREVLAEAAAWVRALLEQDKETAEAGGHGDLVAGDGAWLPFPDGCFDRVIAAEVLEHVPDDGAVVAELARVLRPGGVLVVTVPRWYPEAVNWALSAEYHNVPGGHVRIYRQAQMRQRLRTAGLTPYRYHYAHALHSPYWWLRCALGPDSESNRVVKAYHRLLVWDITAKSPLTRWPEAALNPVLGKSLVVYARKPPEPVKA